MLTDLNFLLSHKKKIIYDKVNIDKESLVNKLTALKTIIKR